MLNEQPAAVDSKCNPRHVAVFHEEEHGVSNFVSAANAFNGKTCGRSRQDLVFVAAEQTIEQRCIYKPGLYSVDADRGKIKRERSGEGLDGATGRCSDRSAGQRPTRRRSGHKGDRTAAANFGRAIFSGVQSAEKTSVHRWSQRLCLRLKMHIPHECAGSNEEMIEMR